MAKLIQLATCHDAPASSSKRLVTGAVHVPCTTPDGQKSQPRSDSIAFAPVNGPVVQRQFFWMSPKKPNLFFSVACHVARRAWVRNQSKAAAGRDSVRLVGNRRGTRDPRFALELVEERAWLVHARAPPANRGKEPHLVLHDRAAQLRANPVDRLDLGGGGDPERLDLVGEVAAVHGRVREVAVDACRGIRCCRSLESRSAPCCPSPTPRPGPWSRAAFRRWCRCR